MDLKCIYVELENLFCNLICTVVYLLEKVEMYPCSGLFGKLPYPRICIFRISIDEDIVGSSRGPARAWFGQEHDSAYCIQQPWSTVWLGAR
jgi:hypothetical protein